MVRGCASKSSCSGGRNSGGSVSFDPQVGWRHRVPFRRARSYGEFHRRRERVCDLYGLSVRRTESYRGEYQVVRSEKERLLLLSL